MKKRSRDINIFSVSALDLFASALGAFILLSLVFVIFFMMTSQTSAPPEPEPVTCPDPVVCPQVEDPEPLKQALEACQNELQAQQVAAASCEYEKSAVAATVEDFEFPHLDLVVALDVTGSMYAQIDGLKREIDQLMSVMAKLAPSFGMGIVAFGDRYWEVPLYQQDILEVKNSSANEAALKRFIGSLHANMGHGIGYNWDGPEAVLAALNAAIGSSWRPEAQRQIIVVVTDNPAYPEEQAAALQAAAAFAASRGGRTVSAVAASTTRGPGTEEFLKRLADAGGGEFVHDGGSMTANLLLSLL